MSDHNIHGEFAFNVIKAHWPIQGFDPAPADTDCLITVSADRILRFGKTTYDALAAAGYRIVPTRKGTSNVSPTSQP